MISINIIKCDLSSLDITGCKLILENALDNEISRELEGYDWLD